MAITHQDIAKRIAALDAERSSLKELCGGLGHDKRGGRICRVCGHADAKLVRGLLAEPIQFRWESDDGGLPKYWSERVLIDIGARPAEEQAEV